MHFSNLPLLLALIPLIPSTLATPIPTSPLHSLSLSLLTPPLHPLHPLAPRAPAPPISIELAVRNIRVNVPASSTYIMLRVTGGIASSVIPALLSAALSNIATHLQRQGDGLLPGGRYDWLGRNAAALYVENANNHQTTFGVLLQAVRAVQSWMGENRWVSCTFEIWDGVNQVGVGRITPGEG